MVSCVQNAKLKAPLNLMVLLTKLKDSICDKILYTYKNNQFYVCAYSALSKYIIHLIIQIIVLPLRSSGEPNLNNSYTHYSTYLEFALFFLVFTRVGYV